MVGYILIVAPTGAHKAGDGESMKGEQETSMRNIDLIARTKRNTWQAPDTARMGSCGRNRAGNSGSYASYAHRHIVVRRRSLSLHTT